MKANQKLLNKGDDAVSPVIAVILMVAITVVLAATVYVWVSGFSASGSQAKNLAVSQGTATNLGTTGGSVPFTLTSISPNFQLGNLKVTSSGGLSWLPATAAGASALSMQDNGVATSGMATTTALNAGDVITLVWGSSKTGPAAGDTVNFIDTGSGNVVASLVLH